MSTKTQRIVCEVCSLASPAVAWRENNGNCPNCLHPCGPEERKLLGLARTPPGPDEEVRPRYPDTLDLDDWYI